MVPFWVRLKEGYDAFETTGKPPVVKVCGKQYLVNVSFPGESGSPERAVPGLRENQSFADAGNRWRSGHGSRQLEQGRGPRAARPGFCAARASAPAVMAAQQIPLSAESAGRRAGRYVRIPGRHSHDGSIFKLQASSR